MGNGKKPWTEPAETHQPKKKAAIALSQDYLKQKVKIEPEELPPEEWDFRRVREADLEAAIFYEHARSCDWVLAFFANWHRKKFRHKDKALREWNGLTVAQLLEKPFEERPQDVNEWLSATTPQELLSGGLLFDLAQVGAFPKPFLCLPSPHTFHIKPRAIKKRPALWLRTAFPPVQWLRNSPPPLVMSPDGELREDVSCLRELKVIVDLRFSKSSMLKDFEALLDKLDFGSVEKLQIPTAKQAIPPWKELKQLAAYRLARIGGMKYERAQAFAKGHLRKRPMDNAPDVLPIYAPSSFSEAVAETEERINIRFSQKQGPSHIPPFA